MTTTTYAMADLEKAVDVTSVADLCIALQLTRQQVFAYRRSGLTPEQAADLTDAAELDPSAVWDAWQPFSRAAAKTPPATKSQPDPNVVWEEPPPEDSEAGLSPTGRGRRAARQPGPLGSRPGLHHEELGGHRPQTGSSWRPRRRVGGRTAAPQHWQRPLPSIRRQLAA